jgi:uncharacterized protein YndB with AHSA1/START domain
MDDAGSDLVRLERLLPAAPARVWAALTDAALVPAWFTPSGWRVDSVEIDAREGGVHRMALHDPTMPGAVASVTARFTEVVPDRLLVSHETVYGDGASDSITVELRLELTEQGTGTLLVVTQGPFPSGVLDLARRGWDASLERLAGVLGD